VSFSIIVCPEDGAQYPEDGARHLAGQAMTLDV